jgi:hypothetical protein
MPNLQKMSYFKWPQSHVICQGVAYTIHQPFIPACSYTAYWSSYEVPVTHLQLLCGLLHVTQASTIATRNAVNSDKTLGHAVST